MAVEEQMRRLLQRAAQDTDVLAVFLFGSAARGDTHAGSDVDVCLVLGAAGGGRVRQMEKRLGYLGDVDLDVQIFQSLPLPVRIRVLREGRVLFCRDEDALYEVAFATVRAFERFKRTYHACLEEVARDRS
ncbi:nucleotidyltransferase domain-containing protein [Candidatus Binatia bacterium]|nr:nucleotidyltransferase domain-containing protein [Candidatus Binatia bacterium]